MNEIVAAEAGPRRSPPRILAGGLCFIFLLSLTSIFGCGSTARDLPLDNTVARESLTAFLDAWKQGQKVDELQSRQPAITGRDSDWDSGRKLTNYTIVSDTDDGTNASFTVDLEIQGRPKQTVVYTVGTSPVITVFRDE